MKLSQIRRRIEVDSMHIRTFQCTCTYAKAEFNIEKKMNRKIKKKRERARLMNLLKNIKGYMLTDYLRVVRSLPTINPSLYVHLPVA
jgi:hypothetical protein